MISTGLVTGFGPLVATQMLWGLAWTFASGADVAWLTDELADPARTAAALVRSGRAQLTGAATGIVGVGAAATLVPRTTAMLGAGAAMLLLGAYVAARFQERRFVPAPERRVSASWSIFTDGLALVRRSRPILVMFAATFLVNGAADASGRLQARRLVDLGLPVDPVVWVTGLAVVSLVVGAVALRVVQARIAEPQTALVGYMLACAAGAVGLAALAAAHDEVSASVGVLLVAGIAMPLTRTLATIWVNRQTSSDVRATVHSFLAQAEYAGEIVCGAAIAVVAGIGGLVPAVVSCAVLFGIAILLVRRVALSRPAAADESAYAW
jgi:hypothetical protein